MSPQTDDDCCEVFVIHGRLEVSKNFSGTWNDDVLALEASIATHPNGAFQPHFQFIRDRLFYVYAPWKI